MRVDPRPKQKYEEVEVSACLSDSYITVCLECAGKIWPFDVRNNAYHQTECKSCKKVPEQIFLMTERKYYKAREQA